MSGSTFATLIALDDRLAAKGVPPMTEWWRAEARRFYEHHSARLWAACVGRGGSKSTVLYKVALAESLFGDFAIPPGERHWASITSRAKEEASKAIAIISAWLKLLGIRHTPTDGVIELKEMPRGFRITAASVGGNSGWRSYFDGADEVAKWTSEGALGIDAAEVLASKAAMTTTHAKARRMIVSTPYLDSGPFYSLITNGTTTHAFVSGPTATWVAAPHVTEEQTHRLEPNERVHAREYKARFSSAFEFGYFLGLIEPCTATWTSQPYDRRFSYKVSIDPAFARDLFAISVQHAEGDRIVVDRVDALTPPRGGTGLSPTACLRHVRGVVTEYRATKVLTDQHHAATLTELGDREGVRLEPIPWTATSKSERFEQARILMRDRRLVLPNNKPLLRELNGIGTKLLPSGHERIEGRHNCTDDRCAAMVLGVSTLATATPATRMLHALREATEQKTINAQATNFEHMQKFFLI